MIIIQAQHRRLFKFCHLSGNRTVSTAPLRSCVTTNNVGNTIMRNNLLCKRNKTQLENVFSNKKINSSRIFMDEAVCRSVLNQ